MDGDVRIDPALGTLVHIVADRQGRPNLPSAGCPFCPGGREAPAPYDVRWFSNRWPAMPDRRCEVVLYTDRHDTSLAGLGVDHVLRVVDLWAERTAVLGARADVDHVLVFENRGAEVGATISHPHGQIYAYDHVPDRPRRRLAGDWRPDDGDGARRVVAVDGWLAAVPHAPRFPVEVSIAPLDRVADLPSLDGAGRTALARMLVDVLGRLDRLYGRPLPYMMWIDQRPTDGGHWPSAWLEVRIVSPWRSAGLMRYIAAAEVACDEFFNPVRPEDLAADLREIRLWDPPG